MDEYFKENPLKDDMDRRIIQDMLKVSVNTIKEHIKSCQNLSLVEFSRKEGNVIYYKRRQKAIKKPLIGVNYEELKNYLFKSKGVKNYNRYTLTLQKLEKRFKIGQNTASKGKFDTLLLTPLLKNLTPPVKNTSMSYSASFRSFASLPSHLFFTLSTFSSCIFTSLLSFEANCELGEQNEGKSGEIKFFYGNLIYQESSASCLPMI